MKRQIKRFVIPLARRLRTGLTVGLAAVGMAAALPVGAHAMEYSFDCVADPSKTLKIGSAVSGILKDVRVGRGDHVKKGETIATIDSEVEAANVALNRARAGSTADIEVQKARLENSRKKFERVEELYKKKVATAVQLEDLRAEVKIVQGQLAQAELTRKLAQLELLRSEKVLQQRTIKSPIDGIVTQRLLSEGEFVYQEASIVILARLDPLYVEVFVPVTHHADIRTGDLAKVRFSSGSGADYSASVIVVDNVFDPASGTFGIRLELPNPGNRLPAGQRCIVRFDLPQAAPTNNGG
jgi:RND family efflux transporter MFP subunit